MAFEDEIDAALHLAPILAEAAGAIIRRHFRSRIEVIDKSDASPVTIADRESELAMRRLIGERFPGHGIIGEEYGEERPDADFVWVLDPIDGTKSFISGVPLFGTLIGLLYRGRPVLGVLDQPVSGERWIGCTGHPTQFNGRNIATRACDRLDRATLFTTTPDMFEGSDQVGFSAVRRQVKLTRYGTDCYAYGLLALGFVDLVIEAKMKLHDFCALVPIIEGAGGIITGWRGEVLGQESDGRILACGDPALHEAARALLETDLPVKPVMVAS
jgi:histidinol phosphatase-like enzyme (inositol monophosphatase family)